MVNGNPRSLDLGKRQKDEIDWLDNLPYYLEDHQNIIVHAGFDLDLALKNQDPHEMLWVRSPYINM